MIPSGKTSDDIRGSLVPKDVILLARPFGFFELPSLLIILIVSADSQCTLFLRDRSNFGIHWSAAVKSRSLKLIHTSSTLSVRKQS